MRKLKKINLDDVIVYIYGIAIVLGSIIYDKTSLPLGWELAKVEFWQLFSLLVIFLWIIRTSYQYIRNKTKPETPSKAIVLLFIAFILALIFSDKSYIFIKANETTALYSWIIKLFSKEGGIDGRVALWGNQFRYFGLITISLILSSALILKSAIKPKNWKSLFYFFLLSSLLQSIWAISQFLSLIGEKEMLKEGKWIYGGYGQTNFLVGHLLVGLVVGYYFLHSKEKIYNYFAYSAIVIITLASILTLSYLGIFMILLCNAFLILQRLKDVEWLNTKLSIIFLASIIFIVPAINIVGGFNQDLLFRAYIWADIYDYYLKRPFIERNMMSFMEMLFGSGFDNLIFLLSRSQRILNPFIDRAHNIVFDLLSSAGLFGLVTSMYVLATGLKLNINENKNTTYAAFALLMLFIRSLIHTNSISNIVHLLILCAMVYALKTKPTSHNNKNAQRYA
ncbi:hypothetical protein KC909_02900 [Candidatus Dojkabacteria bacterium]|uniref:O-antigen ligase domain-containing protein n=1 Tax=Candidatus Dojkabacteria bacterium TaxID=2099670 RepID=A0A955L611_9BACT|nr:hypothetical protein [Candidatus Dojkabacteria bacterium]